jgi:hypothetical protein
MPLKLPTPRRKHFIFATLLALALVVAVAPPAHATPPKVFLADPQVLADSKAALTNADSPLQSALKKLLAAADARLGQKPPSVMDKKAVPPSGDKHDYMSQAPYFWRDTNSPGGWARSTPPSTNLASPIISPATKNTRRRRRNSFAFSISIRPRG